MGIFGIGKKHEHAHEHEHGHTHDCACGHSREERNKLGDAALLETVGRIAADTLEAGADYTDPASAKPEFDCLVDVSGHGLYGLLRVVTDTGTAYFAAEENRLLRLDLDEHLYAVAVAHFTEEHPAARE